MAHEFDLKEAVVFVVDKSGKAPSIAVLSLSKRTRAHFAELPGALCPCAPEDASYLVQRTKTKLVVRCDSTDMSGILDLVSRSWRLRDDLFDTEILAFEDDLLLLLGPEPQVLDLNARVLTRFVSDLPGNWKFANENSWIHTANAGQAFVMQQSQGRCSRNEAEKRYQLFSATVQKADSGSYVLTSSPRTLVPIVLGGKRPRIRGSTYYVRHLVHLRNDTFYWSLSEDSGRIMWFVGSFEQLANLEFLELQPCSDSDGHEQNGLVIETNEYDQVRILELTESADGLTTGKFGRWLDFVGSG